MVHPSNNSNNATSSNDSNSNAPNSTCADQIVSEEGEPPNSGTRHVSISIQRPPPTLSITSSNRSTNSSISDSDKPSPISEAGGNPQSQLPSTGSTLSSIPSALLQPHTLTINQTVQLLSSNINHGLSSKEAESRLSTFGPNQLKENKGASAWTIFLRQCANALTLVLVAAMALSFGVKDWVEGGVVTAVIVTNVGIGFIQEYKAERMMASLRSLSSPTAIVVRSSNIVTIQSSELVLGDIVLFRTGDVLPADVRLIESTNLEVDEAALTGESLPSQKTLDVIPDPLSTLGAADRTNNSFAGTVVTKGRGRGIVIATAMQTQIGLIAAAMAQKQKQDKSIPFYKKWWEASAKWLGLREGTPLQIKLNKLAYLLLSLAVVCAIIVFGVAEFDITNEVVLYAIALGIGVIPESLVAVLTITFSVGAKRMALSNVVVRRLDALEALGGVSDVCSDKTGTLTQGKMVVKKLWTPTSSSQTESGNLQGTSYTVDQTGATAFEPKGGISVDSTSSKKENLTIGDLPSPVQTLCTAASLCNMAELVETDGVFSARGDPTEIALAVLAAKAGFARESLLVNCSSSSSPSNEKSNPRYEMENEWPFDSSIKRMTTSFIDSRDLKGGLDSTRTLFMKGAVERVLECCTSLGEDPAVSKSLDEETKAQIINRMEKMASSGLRVLAFATRKFDQPQMEQDAQAMAGPKKDDDSIKVEKLPVDNGANSSKKPLPRTLVEQDLTFVGLAGLYDPPRAETRGSVLACHEAGITVRMLTGDHFETARAIAREVGILDGTEGPSAVMTANQFDALSESEVDALEDLPLVIARCSPTTKVNMINAGKRRGLYIAMGGDGVNDVPSLKQAPIGIAMGLNGTDIAKDSADLILVDDKFDSIVNGIREGRTIFDNIQKFIIALLVANVGEVILLLIGLAFRDGNNDSVFPLSPIQILWANMVTASLPAIGLGLEVGGADIMKRKPHNLKDGIFSRAVIADLLFYGFTMGWTCLLTFVVMIYGLGSGVSDTFDCNSTVSEECSAIFEARSTVFTALILQLLLICWELVSIDQTFFSKDSVVHLWRNQMLFWSVIFGAVTIPICLYIPKFNTEVFRHSPLYGPGWGVALAATSIFIASVELWKWLARRGAWPWLARVSGGSVPQPKKNREIEEKA